MDLSHPQSEKYHLDNITFEGKQIFTSLFLCLMNMLIIFCVSDTGLGNKASKWIDGPYPQGTCSLVREKEK